MDSAPELDAADGFRLDLAEFRADLRIASTDPRMPPEVLLGLTYLLGLDAAARFRRPRKPEVTAH